MKFTVQAPDGRRVTLEGDHTPTEQELNQVFGISEQPAQTQSKNYALGKLGTIDRGLTFGLGRKAGGLINAIGSYPVNRIAELAGVKNTPSFWDEYHAVVDPTMQAINEFHEDRPVEATALELSAGIFNPANKLGVGYIAKGGSLANKAARAAGVGAGVGGVAGGLNAERAEDVAPNAVGGSVGGAVIGGALPLAAGGIGKAVNAVRNARNPQAMTSLSQMVEAESLNNAINEAQRTGRSILEVGDDSILQAAQKVRQQTPEARQILSQRMQEIAGAQPARTEGVINDALGSQGKNATIRQVAEAARKKAQPMYNELENIGDLAAYETKDIPEQNFKRWFEGSKVVDENGQPVEFYHNTTQDFDAFDVDKIGTSGSGAYHGYGFNFARTPRSEYGRIEKPVYLNAKNLLSSEKKTITKKQLEDMFRTLDNGKNDTLVGDFAYGYYPRNSADYEKHIKEAVNNLYDNAESDLDIYASFGMGSSLSPKEVINAFKKLGYDGASETLDNKLSTVVVFNPNQIKSVNNSGAWSSSPSLSDAGWKPESQLANTIKNNDVLADVIARVKRANSSLKNLPDTDFRVVNEARKALSQASLNRTDISGHEARMALNELDPMLDKIIPQYKEARGIYENAHQFENAADIGRDVFNARQSPDDFNAIYGGLSASEKQAARIGLRDELMNKIGSSVNETSALNKFLPKNVREKIMTIAGKAKGEKIIDEAEQAVKLRRNINKLFNGSPTSSNQSLRDMAGALRRFVKNPWDTTINALLSPYDNRRNIRVADALTSRDLADLLQQTAPQNIDFSKASQITPYLAQYLANNQ